MRVVFRGYSFAVLLVALLALATACGGSNKGGATGLKTDNPIIGSALDATATIEPTEVPSDYIARDWPNLSDITPAEWAAEGFGVVRAIPAELAANGNLSTEEALAKWREYLSNASMVGGAGLEGTNLWAVLCSSGKVVSPPVSTVEKSNFGDTWDLQLGSGGNNHIIVLTQRGFNGQVMLDARIDGGILVASEASEERYQQVVFTEKPEWGAMCGS